MVKKESFLYDSRDGVNKIYGMKWIPEASPVCVLQIIHGMAEHIGCYDHFATYMAELGVLVVGEDHLGHGKSVPDGGLFGYMCKDDPATVMVRDAHRLKKMIQEENPGIPYFILGHSMGSFILRNYMLMYGTGITGAIIMATGYLSKPKLIIGKMIASTITAIFGEKHRSNLMYLLVFGKFNARIENPVTAGDWVCANPERIRQCEIDPLCSFQFTMNGIQALIRLAEKANDCKLLYKIPKDLPIFLMSGKEDPLGDYGRGIQKIYQQYIQNGFQNVNMKMYDACRHEILNEVTNKKVYEDIFHWLMGNEEVNHG